MRINLPSVYSQQDSRWGRTLLGFNKQTQFNIYNYGCLITCLAMLCKYYNKDETPVSINEKLINLGGGKGFATGGGDYIWGAIHKIFTDINEVKTETPDPLSDDQINQIKSSLDQGNPVMIQIDVNPKTVENDTHYALIVDYDSNDENNFTIADPIGGRVHSLKDYLGWFRPSARKTIYKFVLFTGPKPTTKSDGKIFELLVQKSTQWDLTVSYFNKDLDPDHTLFQKIQDIIEGIKSHSTDLQNKLETAEGNLATAEQEVQNRIEQLARVKMDCQVDLDKQKAYYEAIIKDTKNNENLRGYYEGVIKDYQNKLDKVSKEKGDLLNQIVALEKATAGKNIIVFIYELLKNFFSKKT